jgi:hypothetical protein
MYLGCNCILKYECGYCTFRYWRTRRRRENSTRYCDRTAPLSLVRFSTPVPVLLERNTQSMVNTSMTQLHKITVILSIECFMYRICYGAAELNLSSDRWHGKTVTTILILIPYIIDYVEINQLNALNFILFYFSEASQFWFLYRVLLAM